MTLAEIRYLSMRQFDAYSLVSQVVKLENEFTMVQAAALGMGGKNTKNVLNGIAARVSALRRGTVDEQDIIEAQLDGILGQSIGPVSTAGLSSFGIGYGPKPG